MKQRNSIALLVCCILIYNLLLSGCSGDTLSDISPIPSVTQHPSIVATDIPSVKAAITATPTFNNKPFIITPDDLFTFPELRVLITPSSEYFCERIPPPQVIANVDEFSILSGVFVLCPTISWPLVNTVMDLDMGKLVSTVDTSGDLSMDYSHPDLNGETFYGVTGLNNAHIDEIETNSLNYEYCENLLQNKKNPGVLIVQDGAIACVRTTDGQIAIIRVESIFPLNTQGVEFSFAVLKK